MRFTEGLQDLKEEGHRISLHMRRLLLVHSHGAYGYTTLHMILPIWFQMDRAWQGKARSSKWFWTLGSNAAGQLCHLRADTNEAPHQHGLQIFLPS